MSRSRSPSPRRPADPAGSDASASAGRVLPVALIPAAGRATRLGGPALSKELVEVGPMRRPVIRFLLDGLARAGIDRAFVMIRPSKWDIPERLGAGDDCGLRLAYLTVPRTRSICETLDRAYPFVRDRAVAVGFPDVLYRPEDAFSRIVDRWRRGEADAVLVLVPTDRPHKADVVWTDRAGQVVGIDVKPRLEPGPDEPYLTWIGAVWGPAITELLHDMVRDGRTGDGGRELYPSDVLLEGLEQGLRIEAVALAEGRHLDVGTPEDLARAGRWPG